MDRELHEGNKNENTNSSVYDHIFLTTGSLDNDHNDDVGNKFGSEF